MELTGNNISYKYPSSNKYILKDVNISLNSKKITGLIGNSGNGKSTLCKILSNYIPKYEGEVFLNNEPLPKKGFCPVQLIFQHPEKVMNPKWKMKDILHESWDVDDELLNEFGIQKSWMNRFPSELSGGELQRYSVLRSLNPKTKFLIADEMTTMLDAVTQVQIIDSVIKIIKKRNIGLLIVSHDLDLIDTICDDKIYLKDINNI
ncbi:ABC transporter ATP-binding protein [uncultured Methanobrevibacter sp.]|uniref:ABC transporter ATP-binding protein n=1 Tax=uncultured Methanobrevibacter sp. TaxID=253161 RepID=UPI0026042240|nr:ATP-binding cassette domain-containing protein [uncultured Methanobrevibacter sp.]